LRKLITTVVVLFAFLLGLAVRASAPHAAQRTVKAERSLAQRALEETRGYRTETWNWQRLMGVRKTATRYTAASSPDLEYRLWVRNLWRRRALKVRRLALNPPHKQQWLCIHRYEGHWRENSGNGYYGGLQMDISFQRHYGAWLLRKKGTADRWSPIEQMWIAERAHRTGHGFYPWPNTARFCGLI
jgi:hypothetical protein